MPRLADRILLMSSCGRGGRHGPRRRDRKAIPCPTEKRREFLAKHTKVVELTNDAGAGVAIAPEWQGRVMTSTCDGLDGPSFGFINRDYIEAGKLDLHMNNSAPKTACGSVPRADNSASGSSPAPSRS